MSSLIGTNSLAKRETIQLRMPKNNFLVIMDIDKIYINQFFFVQFPNYLEDLIKSVLGFFLQFIPTPSLKNKLKIADPDVDPEHPHILNICFSYHILLILNISTVVPYEIQYDSPCDCTS